MSFRISFLELLSLMVLVFIAFNVSLFSNNSGANFSAPAGNPDGGIASCPDYSSYFLTLTSSSAAAGFDPGATIPNNFGYNRDLRTGNADFPQLAWTASSSPTNFLLVLQDDDGPSWGHGIWRVAPATRKIAKVDGGGGVTSPTGKITIKHAAVAASSDTKANTRGIMAKEITALETYQAPFPIGQHNYRFKLYALNIEAPVLEAALDGIPRPWGSGASTYPNRIKAIDAALATVGMNPENVSGGCTAILATSEITGAYP